MSSLFTHLPIANYLSEISQTLHEQNKLIVQADPGAGKSTAVPLYLLQNLDLGDRKIIMLEPRRLAASSIAHYLAGLLNEEVGQTVGYQVRNQRKVSAQTRLEIVTEGILSARIQQDPELHGVGLVIFDEFHERSIHADFGLSLCKEIAEVYNERLKILVMSATIDTEMLSGFLDGAPVLKSEGRCFPVTTEYLSKPVASLQYRDWSADLMNLVSRALQDTDDDVLVFLPGQNEIRRIIEQLESRIDTDRTALLPLFGGLQTEQQKQALLPDDRGRRKIVLATNIAETSLTIPNVSAVVDSGLEKTSVYDVSSGMNRLLTQRISQASAEQRQGRAGRIQAGHCYRLWTQSQHNQLEAFATEEILKTDLADLRLAMAQWGVKRSDEIDWLTAPPQAHYAAATQLLQTLGLLDSDVGLTAKGRQAAGLGLTSRLANLVLESDDEADTIKSIAADLVAVLSEPQFYVSREDADLVSRLMALQAYRESRQQALKTFPLKAASSEQAVKVASRLARYFGLASFYQASLSELQSTVGRLLCFAYPDRIAKRKEADINQQSRYQLANGKSAVLDSHNRLKASEWLVAADLDGQRKDGRIYLAAEVDEADLRQFPGFETVAAYSYNAQRSTIEGKQVTRIGRIIVKEAPLQKPDPAELQKCLLQAIHQTGLKLLPWKKSTLNWLNRVRWLQANAPQHTADWMDLSSDNLQAELDNWLLPYMQGIDSIDGLKSLDLEQILKSQLDYAVLQEIDRHAPQSYQTPNGKTLPIDYQSGQLPKVSVILQELFGELKSPELAWGNSCLTFELLSPARRPIQVTNDLARFWQSSYFEVAKEMKGRYPKHRWPDEPLLEKPGRSIKPKK